MSQLVLDVKLLGIMPGTTVIKLGARDLRVSEPTEEQFKRIKRNPIYLVLDNVLDTYNVGSIFRLADAVAAQKLYLCGQTEIPPNHKIIKASVGTWKWVAWSYASTAVEVLNELKTQNSPASPSEAGRAKLKIVAIEQSPKAIRYDKFEYKLPICLVVGNETEGISKEVLEMVDEVVEIPMFGVNKSLNVMVAVGIVLYKLMEKL